MEEDVEKKKTHLTLSMINQQAKWEMLTKLATLSQ